MYYSNSATRIHRVRCFKRNTRWLAHTYTHHHMCMRPCRKKNNSNGTRLVSCVIPKKNNVFIFAARGADMKQINRWHWRSRTSRDIALKMTSTNMFTIHDTFSLSLPLPVSRARAAHSLAGSQPNAAQITNKSQITVSLFFSFRVHSRLVARREESPTSVCHVTNGRNQVSCTWHDRVRNSSES